MPSKYLPCEGITLTNEQTFSIISAPLTLHWIRQMAPTEAEKTTRMRAIMTRESMMIFRGRGRLLDSPGSVSSSYWSSSSSS